MHPRRFALSASYLGETPVWLAEMLGVGTGNGGLMASTWFPGKPASPARADGIVLLPENAFWVEGELSEPR